MKKLLSILGSVGMIGTAGATVVACGNKDAAKPVALDFKKLDEAITSAETALKEGTAKSVSAKKILEAVISLSKSLKESAKSQEAINSAVESLNKAVENFKNSINKDALNGKIAEAKEAIATSKKTEEAIKTLNKAITAAEAVAGKTAATQEEVDIATSTLEAAIKAFNDSENAPVDKTELKNKIAEAEVLVKNSKKAKEVTDKLQWVIDEAKTIDSNKDATWDDVDFAKTMLEVAIETFNSNPNLKNKEDLKNKIAEAKTLLKNSKKSDEAIKTLNKAITAAEAVAGKTAATQEEVDIATNVLSEAIANFKKEPNLHDKKELEAKIAEAKTLLKNSKKSDEAKEFLQGEIAKAEQVAQNSKADRKTIDFACSYLMRAIGIYNRAK